MWGLGVRVWIDGFGVGGLGVRVWMDGFRVGVLGVRFRGSEVSVGGVWLGGGAVGVRVGGVRVCLSGEGVGSVRLRSECAGCKGEGLGCRGLRVILGV